MGQNGREIPVAAPAFLVDTDLLIVMLGTNDLLQGRSPEQAAERLERFLSGISLDRSKIMLIAPPPMAMGEMCIRDREKLNDYLRSLEIKKEIAQTEEQLSQLNLLWLDEQRQTIASLIGEIKTLRDRQQDTVDQRGQLKAQIRQLEDERLPGQRQKLIDLENRICETFPREYQEQTGLPRYQQELTRLKRAATVSYTHLLRAAASMIRWQRFTMPMIIRRRCSSCCKWSIIM